MYYSYIEIEYVATSFSPARMDLALKLLRNSDQSHAISATISSFVDFNTTFIANMFIFL
jgi:hypothetical protein